MDTYAPERKLGDHHHGVKSRALRMVGIERVRQESPGVRTLFFSDSEPVSAGQFYLVWIPGKGEVPLSASVISPLDRRAVTVADVGERTRALNMMGQGDLIGIRGPFGRGFRVEDDWLWIGGGVGTAPIVAALSSILDADFSATIVIGAAREEALILLERARRLFTGEGEGLDVGSAPPPSTECAAGEEGGYKGSSAGSGGADGTAGLGGDAVDGVDAGGEGDAVDGGDAKDGGDSGGGGDRGDRGDGDVDDELMDVPQRCAPAIFNDKVSLHICTDDGSTGFKGLASQMAHALIMERRGKDMGLFKGIAACGPEAMMLTILELANLYSLHCQLSLERYMKCGVGICDACSIDGLQVCRDGPVFQGEVLNKLYEFGLFTRDSAGRRVPVPNVRHKTRGI